MSDQQTIFKKKIKKTQKLSSKTPKKQKSKKECSSELMLKTTKKSDTFDQQKNVVQKLTNYHLKHPKIKEGVLQ